MITFWRQPDNKTMKIHNSKTGKDEHVSTPHAYIALTIAEKLGYTVTDHGHKITVEKT